MRISNRLNLVPASSIRKLVPYAQKAKKENVIVYRLNIGDPDTETPEVMLEVLRNWRKKTISYSQSQGDPEFLKALHKYYHRLGFNFIALQNIQVTTGGSEAISFALFSVCDLEEEVITFEPLYTNYNTIASVNQVKLVSVATHARNGFHLPKKADIIAKITPKTKALLICNPNNPTGTVYTREEVEMLVSIAREYKLFLLADEVYREFTYDGRIHVSILEYFREIPDQAILLDSLSKRYSVCGARLGVCVSLNPEIMAGCLRLAQGRLSSGFIDQAMATKLTAVPKSYFTKVHSEFEKRRNVLYTELSQIPGVEISKPEGAFYTIVSLPVEDTEDFSRWLLTDFRYQNETVMLAPAQGFYTTPGMGRNQVRIAYVLGIEKLKKAIMILGHALKEYRPKLQ